MCMEECTHMADAMEDHLLRCMVGCRNAHGGVWKEELEGHTTKSCQKGCEKTMGVTHKQILSHRNHCSDRCGLDPDGPLASLSKLAVMLMVPVPPILGAYKEACVCTECQPGGPGCTTRITFLIVGWILYMMGMLICFPAALFEGNARSGGKTMYSFFMLSSAIAMAQSRQLDKKARDQSSRRRVNFVDVQGNPVGEAVATHGGALPLLEAQEKVDALRIKIQQITQTVEALGWMEETELAPHSVPPSNGH